MARERRQRSPGNDVLIRYFVSFAASNTAAVSRRALDVACESSAVRSARWDATNSRIRGVVVRAARCDRMAEKHRRPVPGTVQFFQVRSHLSEKTGCRQSASIPSSLITVRVSPRPWIDLALLGQSVCLLRLLFALCSRLCPCRSRRLGILPRPFAASIGAHSPPAAVFGLVRKSKRARSLAPAPLLAPMSGTDCLSPATPRDCRHCRSYAGQKKLVSADFAPRGLNP